MFQLEPITWLQSYIPPILGRVLEWVSVLGYTPVYVGAILVLAFGVRLRPGLALLVVLLFNGIAIEGLKQGLALPRPEDVLEVAAAPTGGTGVWALPSPRAIAAARSRGDDFGFPSGHVGTAAAFLVGLALLFKWRTATVVACFWVPLMALARLYLGRHFLADVMGGAAVGLVVALAATRLFPTSRPVSHDDQSAEDDRQRVLVLVCISVALVLLVPLVGWLDGGKVGRLAGASLGVWILSKKGYPDDAAPVRRRAARVAIGGLVYAATFLGIGFLMDAGGLNDTRIGDLGSGAAEMMIMVAGAPLLARRLRLCGSAVSTR